MVGIAVGGHGAPPIIGNQGPLVADRKCPLVEANLP